MKVNKKHENKFKKNEDFVFISFFMQYSNLFANFSFFKNIT
jgi:hypothetical protein